MLDHEKRILQYELHSEVLEQAIPKLLHILDENISYFSDGLPHVSQDLKYAKEENKLWTAGFFPGMTYLAYGLTQEKRYLRNEACYLDSFEKRRLTGHMATHDIGFLFSLTCVAAYKMTGNKWAYDVAVKAANALCERFHPVGGYIQAWQAMNLVRGEVQIIIDCMMNLPLLYWASSVTKNSKYSEIAESHARVSMNSLVRENGSTYHTYCMDVETGKKIKGKTHQGHRDESTWARGQAWSIYGFALSYGATKNKDFLNTAIKSADYFIENLPKDYVPYWDFDFNDGAPDIKDSSAGSIAATVFLELSQYVDGSRQELYQKTARTILEQLVKHYTNDEAYEGAGFLKEGMYHRDHGFNEFTIWGDYFFLEALIKSVRKVELLW